MSIAISKAIRNELPDDENDDIKDLLWKKSGKCFLCGRQLNQQTDQIEADHDVPVAEGGETNLKNLNLAHKKCNNLKKNHPSVRIRPYLELAAFAEEHEGAIYYSDCLRHFAIKPKSVSIERDGNTATFHLPNGKVTNAEVFTEQSLDDSSTFEFAFVELPREAITHDEDCQPRSIKTSQLKAIFFDLGRNPLHEQPTVRTTGTGKNTKLLLFDGQHKTLAKWVGGADTVVVKIYMNLDKDQANFLVGSIQSTVKKLPLTPFELAQKMNDEFSERFESYVHAAQGPISEEGFIQWLPVSDRGRGKTEIKNAVIALLLTNDDPTLEFKERVGKKALGIKEAQFVSKLLAPLMQFSPLSVEGDDGVTQRANERVNTIHVVNRFEQICIAPGEESGASIQDKDRAKRMLYQSALEYCMNCLKSVAGICCKVDSKDAMLKAPLTRVQLKSITQAIQRMADHPVWTANLETGSQKLRNVDEALKKNQGAEKAFRAVGLDVGYLLHNEALPSDWDE